MNLTELINSNSNISITVGIQDLETFAKKLIQLTKSELEEIVISEKSEMYVSPSYVSETFGVDKSTLWRYAKRGVLIPIEAGGKRKYRLSECKDFFNGRK